MAFLYQNRKVEAAGACKESEYFSDYTKGCEKAVLQIGLSKDIQSLDLEDLYDKYPAQEILVPENPAYAQKTTGTKNRRYKGISLKSVVMDLLPNGDDLMDYVLAVTCLDGFDPVLDASILAKLNEYQAIIATEELSIDREGADLTLDGKWELLHLSWGHVSPGPFYIVWNNMEGTYWKGWPLQVKSLRLIKKAEFEATIAKLEPNEKHMNADPVSNVELGFRQFKGKCLTCHSINGVGGKKANVDLIERVGLFKGEDPFAYLNAIIRNPPAGMRDILDIKMTDEDIHNINSYLMEMAEN